MLSNQLSEHFNRYFEVSLANTPAKQDQVFQIRHTVYCEEFGFEPTRPDKKEQDHYDPHAIHCLLKHKPSGKFVGCIRLILARNTGGLALPYEALCKDTISPNFTQWAQDHDYRYAEISRLAIISDFRRRSGEAIVPDGESDPEASKAQAEERRHLPGMSLGLYLAATAISLQHGLEAVIAVMELRLARLLTRYGMHFTQIGETIEHRGKRAPFIITKQELFTGISPDISALIESVDAQLFPNNSRLELPKPSGATGPS